MLSHKIFMLQLSMKLYFVVVRGLSVRSTSIIVVEKEIGEGMSL